MPAGGDIRTKTRDGVLFLVKLPAYFYKDSFTDFRRFSVVFINLEYIQKIKVAARFVKKAA